MAPSINNLRRLLEYRSKNERLEMFDGQGRLVLAVTHYILKLCSEDDKIIASLERLDDSAKLCWGHSRHTDEDRNFFILFKSFMAELKEFFHVPKARSTQYHNELVAAFIDLLLEIFEEILRLQPYFILRSKDSIKTLKMDLKFLITFLGDIPSRSTGLETTKNVLTDIEAVANDIGSFLYSFFFTTDGVSVARMYQALFDLLGTAGLVKEKIKQHCITAPNLLPGSVTPKTAVVSLFLVDSLLDDLRDLISHKDDRIVDVKDEAITIHDELKLLRTLLAEIEVERYPELEEFLIQIRDIAYEVEYIINSFAPVWYLTIRLPQVHEKIKLIRMLLQDMKKKYDSGMLKGAQYPSLRAPLQYPPIGEEIVVGLEDEVIKIKDQLTRGPEYLQIISIFGMPGLGKTTLAKKLYNDPAIVFHFYKRAWSAVSQTYQRRNILIDILTSMSGLNKDAIMDMEDESLGEKLYKSLKGRRYFIVMDDIWNVNAWDDMKRYFPDDRNRSRILFTTRHENVGFQASTPAVVNSLRFLTGDECWELLKWKVFHKEPCPEELVEIGKQITADCDGLPLAVVVIASVLANLEKKRTMWKEVSQSISSHMSKGPNEYQNILELSYSHLPMHLKPCFLYFGVFEEDREIPVRKLILLWVAEGFIEKREHRSSEDVAQEYLADLINRGLVLVAKRRFDGGVKACSIHDLLRDMCLRIGEKDQFMKVIQNQISIYEQHHRLSIHSHSYPSVSRPFGLHVRSLLGYLPDPSAFIIYNLKLLKVLDMSTIDLRMHNPTGVEVSLLLKFLAVSSIPSSSIEIFENLNFLFVDNKEVDEIPEILFKMVKLRHVHFSGGAKFSESWRKRAAMGDSFQINNLENISSIFINDENDEKILKCSPHLRRLKCRCTFFWDSTENNYRYPSFNFLNQLESLNISFRPSYISDDAIPDLTNLPLNLKKLTLRNFDLSWKQMKIIEELTYLEVLKLRDDIFEGKQWNTSEGGFQELRFLELDGVQIEHWNASSDDFPKLECLVLRSCQHLDIPSSIGDILSLSKIEVHGCVKSVEESAYKIQEQQVEETGNEELKVIISRSQQ
ncbi:late blight resistance homolog R1A-3 [Olea europaea subsp. europaea]|uniref:Late blight resistance homolog R1A-3 n=1 Tax=Olea europaea subsp. europaea TaxID=158383 RepID=A0A8S0RP52_OLEEU|nr:late blight resistance homolog R1A-3 [Olea europaea subsp. europaea]